MYPSEIDDIFEACVQNIKNPCEEGANCSKRDLLSRFTILCNMVVVV